MISMEMRRGSSIAKEAPAAKNKHFRARGGNNVDLSLVGFERISEEHDDHTSKNHASDHNRFQEDTFNDYSLGAAETEGVIQKQQAIHAMG